MKLIEIMLAEKERTGTPEARTSANLVFLANPISLKESWSDGQTGFVAEYDALILYFDVLHPDKQIQDHLEIEDVQCHWQLEKYTPCGRCSGNYQGYLARDLPIRMMFFPNSFGEKLVDVQRCRMAAIVLSTPTVEIPIITHLCLQELVSVVVSPQIRVMVPYGFLGSAVSRFLSPGSLPTLFSRMTPTLPHWQRVP
ncbi:hypothetical protein B0H17DRAFT_1200646 [Mycena rosella]|uniref:Uncharacterized protein n=1 Tax=Mycena rosella TaxID=1033263 RepID=A0AAD7DIA9_MYCRO|nr:hypothetical protein B0H17DRAFT_1200646 [Mycena rosella]